MKVKASWFSNPREAEFAKCLQSADYSRHGWDLFHSFLIASHNTLAQANRSLVGLPMDDELEQQVIREQEKLKHPEKLAHCLGILTIALEEQRYDFIGSTMANLELHDKKYKGQCMTPPALSRLMAEMTAGELRPDSDKRLTLQEPAVGGGSMVIATSDVLIGKGFQPWDFTWACIDVDWRMYATAFVQLSLLDIPAAVYHGNTISMEMWASQFTFCELRTRLMMPRRCGLAPKSEEPGESPVTPPPPSKAECPSRARPPNK